jgi:hypothetical protein
MATLSQSIAVMHGGRSTQGQKTIGEKRINEDF